MRVTGWLLVVVVAVVGCSGTPGRQTALQVQVVLAAGATSRCVIVAARDGTRERASGPITTEGRNPLRVAVFRDDFDEAVELEALGFADDACTTPTSPPEASERSRGVFTSPTATVTLTLRVRPPGDGGVDDGGVGDAGLVDAGAPDAGQEDAGAPDAGLADAGTEVGLCADGIDNDGDQLTDCDDPDCPAGATCSDGDACTVDDVCAGPGNGCVPGSSVVCNMPPTTQCFANPGVCASNTGQCAYAPTPNVACSDGDTCTVGDTCLADGGCAGTRVTCTPPGECYQATGQCAADGGCLFDVLVDAGCTAGTVPGRCAVDGSCQPGSTFPYAPSNFTEADLPSMTSARTFNCGATVLTTDGTPSWSNLCGGTAPTTRLHTVGGQEVVLVYFESLTVAAGSTLRLTGARPVILAVRGSATVSGIIDASALNGRGAGANVACGSGAGSDGGSASNRGGGGGGGAFGEDGNDGGDGADGARKGARGVKLGNAALVPLRGGCPGGTGGRGSSTDGRGGGGGGAIQLSVGDTLTVAATGRITASGGGGAGGSSALSGNGVGGGGGGSGGGLLLEGNHVILQLGGALTANGGGGGQGGGRGSTGSAGAEGSQTLAGAAPGGSSTYCGGFGGSGGAGLLGATAGATPTCTQAGGSGGGGGGGVGRIRINAATSCTLLGLQTPPATGNGRPGCPAN
jgi:hypothetical protein